MTTATKPKHNKKTAATTSETAVLLQNARQTQGEIRRQIELAQQRIDALEEQIHGVQDELQREDTALEELRGEYLRLDHDVDQATLSVNLLAGSFAGGQTAQRLKDLTEQRDTLATSIHAHEEQLATQRERTEQQIADIRARQQQEQANINECQRMLDLLAQQEQQAREQHGRELWEQITSDIAGYEARLDALRTELGEMRQALFNTKLTARNTLADYPEYAEQLDEIAPIERELLHEEQLLQSYKEFLDTLATFSGALRNQVPGASWVVPLTDTLELTSRQVTSVVYGGTEGRQELSEKYSAVRTQIAEWANYADRAHRSRRR